MDIAYQLELLWYWRRLLERCGVTPERGEPLGERLFAAYDEPGRYHHTLRHVLDVLQDLEVFAAAPPAVELEWAAWFHDAVYEPWATDNEQRSAELAREELPRLGLFPGLIERVAELILYTRDHRAPPEDAGAQLLLDADLAILGADAETYTTYARAIRREYAWVPDAEYRAGRRRVLAAFLERPRIFITARAHQLQEKQARRNLAQEMAVLAAGGGLVVPDLSTYPPVVQEMLREDRLPELGPGRPHPISLPLRRLELEALFAPQVIQDRSAALACLAGLWLYCDCLDEAHTVSQDLATVEGSYWHALMHRREPDFGNAAYWFRRVGRHPIFEPLRAAAELLAAPEHVTIPTPWDPFWFIDYCEKGYREQGPTAALARQIQRREWELLFEHCYRQSVGVPTPRRPD